MVQNFTSGQNGQVLKSGSHAHGTLGLDSWLLWGAWEARLPCASQVGHRLLPGPSNKLGHAKHELCHCMKYIPVLPVIIIVANQGKPSWKTQRQNGKTTRRPKKRRSFVSSPREAQPFQQGAASRIGSDREASRP